MGRIQGAGIVVVGGLFALHEKVVVWPSTVVAIVTEPPRLQSSAAFWVALKEKRNLTKTT